MKTRTMTQLLVLLFAACTSETIVTQRSPARLVPLAQFAAASTGPDLTVGECSAVPAGAVLGRNGLRAVVLLLPSRDSMQRRLLVAVDSAGEIRHYSDMRLGSTPTQVDIDFISGVGSARNLGRNQGYIATRGRAADFFGAASLGNPAMVAREVLRRCSTHLGGTQSSG